MLIRWDRMHPLAALTNPDYTVGIINFRLSHFAQALRNPPEGYVHDKYKFSNDSALYSWTTGTGWVLNYEYHINPGADGSLQESGRFNLTKYPDIL